MALSSFFGLSSELFCTLHLTREESGFWEKVTAALGLWCFLQEIPRGDSHCPFPNFLEAILLFSMSPFPPLFPLLSNCSCSPNKMKKFPSKIKQSPKVRPLCSSHLGGRAKVLFMALKSKPNLEWGALSRSCKIFHIPSARKPSMWFYFMPGQWLISCLRVL